MRHDPRAAFLVESGDRWPELRAVHLAGRIEIVAPSDIDQISQSLNAKYAAFRTPREALPARSQDHYAQSAGLRFIPDSRILSWDNSRIRLEKIERRDNR